MEKPKKFTVALGEDICERIMGGENVFSIGDDPNMPAKQTIIKWLNQKTEDEEVLAFQKLFEEAEKVSSMALGEEAMYIIDGCPATRDDVAKAAKRADVRLELMKRRNPKKYGKLIGSEDGETAKGPVATVKFEIMKQDYGKENEGIETEGLEIVSATVTEQEEDSAA